MKILWKNSKVIVEPTDPLAQDKLERKVGIENLTHLVQSTTQPFVISVEAPWGSGKTTFLEMWQRYLENQGHTCLYFNAWENDFVDDPLIAFIGEMGKVFDQKVTEDPTKQRWEKVQNISKKIVRTVLPITVQLLTQGLLNQETFKGVTKTFLSDGDEIAKLAADITSERIKHFETEKDGIVEFKNSLSELAKSLSEKPDNKLPLVFFIDELDRCRPSFAILLLERIKHLFSVEGVVFVLGMDREQITSSVKSIYGQEMKADGYLRRFIDYSYILPKPKPELFARYLWNRFNLNEVAGEPYVEQILLDAFAKLALIFNLSLRVQEQCFTEINLVYRTTSQNISIFPGVLAFLITLKAYNKSLFEKMYSNLTHTDVEKLLEIFRGSKEGEAFLMSDAGVEIESALINEYFTTTERDNRRNELDKLAKNKNHEEQKRSEMIIDWGLGQVKKGAIKRLLARIEITQDFGR